MPEQRTDIHLPAAQAPTPTGLVAHCNNCGFEWQVQSPNRDDAKGCSFCNAPERAITVRREDE